jgi:phosphate transport system permease protein
MSMLDDLRADHGTTSGQPGHSGTHSTTVPKHERVSSIENRRAVGRISRNDMQTIVGSMGSAVFTTLLLFGRLTPLSGAVGFVVIAFALFIVIYALMISLNDDRPAVIDRVMSAFMTAAATTAIAALAWVVIATIWKGRAALTNVNLYAQDMSKAGPLQPLSEGGILHAVAGSLIIIGISLVLTVPLGIACAVFLNETRSPLTGLVRTVVTAMTALPSIIAGLFIFAMWILVLGWPRSGLAASIAVSLMMLPIIIRSADVVLRLVPGNLREASAALGAPHWRTVWFVVLPTARSGLSTAVILGVARGVGETAPVLLTSGISQNLNLNPTDGPMMSLPLATYDFVRSPMQTQVARGFATAAVLMVLVLILFALARFLGGRPAGRLSKGQARRAENRSERDLERIEAAIAQRSADTLGDQPGFSLAMETFG